MMWSSTAAAYLLQGSVCCEFRNAFLHTFAVTRCCLSYSCLWADCFNVQQSPLASDINNAFLPRQLPLTGYFIFF